MFTSNLYEIRVIIHNKITPPALRHPPLAKGRVREESNGNYNYFAVHNITIAVAAIHEFSLP
ncbi:hypothetical protein NIES4103_48210 [Nostoc sp. NIES-4103]|nr:hypothetical protein NIES4103_48210 [Nostoc sp. NIES-4103]